MDLSVLDLSSRSHIIIDSHKAMWKLEVSQTAMDTVSGFRWSLKLYRKEVVFYDLFHK